jgi:Flp pilus assembly protein TadB
MKKCKKISNFLACLALALMMSCFLFNTTVAQDRNEQKVEEVYEKKIIKQKTVVKQQKEIKARAKRIEKKIIKRKSQKRSDNYDDPAS